MSILKEIQNKINLRVLRIPIHKISMILQDRALSYSFA